MTARRLVLAIGLAGAAIAACTRVVELEPGLDARTADAPPVDPDATLPDAGTPVDGDVDASSPGDAGADAS